MTYFIVFKLVAGGSRLGFKLGRFFNQLAMHLEDFAESISQLYLREE